MAGEFVAGSIVGQWTLDNSPMIKAMDEAERKSKEARDGVVRNLKDAGESGAESFLKGIREKAGRRSVLNESLELLAGGGVAAGIGLAAHTFADFTDKIEKFSDEARNGRVSASELTGEIARSVPVLGDMVKGFDSLREALTGEKAALDDQIEATKRADEAYKAWHESQTAAEGGIRNMADQMRKLNRELEILRAPDALKPFLENAAAAADKAAELKARLFEDASKAKIPGLSLPSDAGMFDPSSIHQAFEQGPAALQIAIAASRAAQLALTKAKNDYGPDNGPGFVPGGEDPSVYQAAQRDRTALDQAQSASDAAQDRVKALQDAGDTLKKLNYEYNEFLSATGTAKEIEAAKNMGVLENAWKKAGSALESWLEKNADAMKKQEDEASRLKESVLTPAERFSSQIAELEKLKNGGFLDPTFFGRLVKKDYDDALGSLPKGQSLPNPGVKAEEIFGSKTVTTADVPQPVEETAENTAQANKLLGTLNDALQTLITQNIGSNLLGVPIFQF